MPVRLKDTESGETRIRSFLDLPKTVFIQNAKTDINPAQIGAVDMEWAAVTGPQAQFPALGTENLATCMGLAVHNPVTKATGLTHLSQDGASTDISKESRLSLIAMLEKVSGQDGQIEARMIGPNMGGYLAGEFVDEVAKVLADYNVVVLSADFGHKAGLTAVAVDSRRWEEGLIRGKVSMTEILNAHGNGGQAEVSKIHAEYVNLERMSSLPGRSPDGLAYNGLTETDLAPGPELQ